MDLQSNIDTVAPTPYGWVITTQTDFDLKTMMDFQKQLLSLARAFGPTTKPAVHVPEAQLVSR